MITCMAAKRVRVGRPGAKLGGFRSSAHPLARSARMEPVDFNAGEGLRRIRCAKGGSLERCTELMQKCGGLRICGDHQPIRRARTNNIGAAACEGADLLRPSDAKH